MIGDRTDPLPDPRLQELARKAAWIARTFGRRRCRFVFNGGYAWGLLRNLRCSYDFEWDALRIHAARDESVPEAVEPGIPPRDEDDPDRDDRSSLVISLKREKVARILGIPLFRHRRFCEVLVCDFSRELPRLKFPDGAARDELIAKVGNLYDGLQKLLVHKALTLDEIKKLPREDFENILSEEFGIRS